MSELLFNARNQRPVCVGTGLVVLDAIIHGSSYCSPVLVAGGSCGNVLSILSYFGWHSYPIARIGDDVAGARLLNDLFTWGVNKELIFQEKGVGTPIIVEKIRGNSHRFEWVCPMCGAWLPRYKPVLAKDVVNLSGKIPRHHVFYFDRVTRSAIELARISKETGALVIFEPSAIGNAKLFSECLELADVVKYSHQRLSRLYEITDSKYIPLEVETLGAHGLRFRFSSKGNTQKKWKFMNACSFGTPIDAVGSGDWCSAGLIELLGYAGKDGFCDIGEKDVEAALRFGQVLAGFNCLYEGARGIMYRMARGVFERVITEFLNGVDPGAARPENSFGTCHSSVKSICPKCPGE